MTDHETTIKLTIEGDDKDLKSIGAQIEEVMKNNPLVVRVDSDTSKTSEELTSVQQKIKEIGEKSANIKLEVNDAGIYKITKATDDVKKGSQEIGNEFQKINNTHFDKLSQNFKSVADQLKSDANITATVSVNELAKIANNPAFERLSVNFKSTVDKIAQDAVITARISKESLDQINTVDFQKLSVNFKGATQQMQTDAKSTSDSIAQEFSNLSGALSGALAGAGGALAADKIFQEANNRAATTWRLNNRYGAEANRIMSEFVNYDIASARPDHDLIQMFEWLSNSGELANVNVNKAMSIFDAVSASGDPLRQRGKQMAYGRYLSSGYEAARMMFRDEGLSDAQLDKLKQANTLEERLNALREIGIEQGAIQIGQNGEIIGQYNTLQGDLGGYNELLSLIDVLVQGATLAFMNLMNVLRPVISTLKDFASANQGLVGGLIIGTIAVAGIGGAVMTAVSVITSFIKTFKTFSNLTGVLSKMGGPGGAPGGGFLNWVRNFNAFAAETAAASSTSALSLSTMAAGIQAMLAPLLMVSAVIAIMIPVVFGIVAEIVIFVRLLGELVKALRFDKLNLEPSIEGIKQIGSAMWEILKAFTVLTTINIVNVIYTATGGIIGTSSALGQFWLAIKEIEIVLKDIDKLDIDENSVIKIDQIKNILNSISYAMVSMASLNLSGLATFITGGFLSTFMNIKVFEDIAKIINDLKIPNIDSKKVEQISKLSELIKKITEASKAVSDNWSTFQITTDMATPFKNAIDTLYSINQKLNETVFYVDSSKTQAINNLKNVVKSLVDASKSISDNWSTFRITTDMSEPIKEAIDELYSINQKLNEKAFSVDSSKTESLNRLKTIVVAVKDSAVEINKNLLEFIGMELNSENFKKAVNELYSINQHLNEKAFNLDNSKITAINNLKTVVKSVADTSKSIIDNKDNFGDDLGKTVEKVKGAINHLYSLNQHINTKPFEVTESIVQGVTNLRTVMTAIKDIGVFFNDNLADIEAITAQEATVKGAISSLYSINQHINSMPFKIDESKTKVINSLKSVIQAIVNALNTAAGVRSAAANMGTQIVDGFRSTVVQLKNVAAAEVGWAINAVKSRYQTAYNAGYALAQKLVTGFRDGLDQHSPGLIAGAAAAEIGFVMNAFEQAKSQLYTKGRDLYMEAVSGFGGGINKGSPGDIANMMSDEMNYTLDAMKSSLSSLYLTAQNLGQNIVSGFGDIDLKINEILKNITIDPILVPLIFDASSLQSNYDNAISEFRNDIKTRYENNIIDRDIYADRNSDSQSNNPVIENHYHFYNPLIEKRATDLIIETVKAEKEREESRY